MKECGTDTSEQWMSIYKKSCGSQTVTFDQLLYGALCYDWIDFKTKAIEDDRFAIRCTVRRPGSN